MPLNRHGYTWGLLAATALGLTACQQPKPPQVDTEALHTHPPATGAGACAALPTDWLSRMPAQQRFVRPADCSTHASTPLFSWGDPTDRLASSAFTFSVRRVGGAVLVQRTGVTEPRLMLPVATLAAGDYEWAVAYTSSNGNAAVTQWRRFSVSGAATDGALRAIDLPEGAQLAAQAAARARPRMLASGSSFAALRSLASQPEHLPVLTLLRSRATAALTTAAPSAPAAAAANPTTLAQAQEVARLVETARTERLRIEALGLVGRLDGQASMLSAAKSRLIALATWSPSGATGEAKSAPANREVYLAMAQGFDLLFNDLSAAERALVLAALRERLLQASRSLSQLDREPYASNGLTSLRHLTQALLLMAGQQGFAEAQSLLDRCWELNRHFIGVWGSDGSHGFGTASAWQELGSQGAFAATARVTTGINLYQIASVRRASEQLIAFTAAGGQQGGAFGDGAERKDFYDSYSASSFRLHAQQSKDAKDAWYWRVKAANSVTPNDASIWQILLLGVDSSPGPTPVPPTSHDWFSAEAGLAAMHSDIRRADRSSVFFRASPFGSYGPAHADQNSLVFVSQGQALLVNAGYTPFVNSPHHKSTRATRYKSALTFDGGFGQAESALAGVRPSDSLSNMDLGGALLRTQSQGNYAAVTGDASAAYQGVDTTRNAWMPQLSGAVRSVVMDKANGLTFVYDWASSASARQWELNFHSPNSFVADVSTVRASNGGASVCLDRHGPATAFSQTMAWDVNPETTQPPQAHARFSTLVRSTEFAHLTVLRESCKPVTLQVTQSGTGFTVLVGGRDTLQFDKRQYSLPAAAYSQAAWAGRAETATSPATGTQAAEATPGTTTASVSPGTSAPAPSSTSQSTGSGANCPLQTFRTWGACRAWASLVAAHGETVSFWNLNANQQGRIEASCSNGQVTWREVACSASSTSPDQVARSAQTVGGIDLATKQVFVARPPLSTSTRFGERKILLAPYPSKNEVARKHDFLGAFVDPASKRPNALSVQVPVSFGGSVSHVNLYENSTPALTEAGSPGRAELRNGILRMAYLPNDPVSIAKLRTQLNSYPIPNRRGFIWDLSFKMGGEKSGERWQLTPYTRSAVLLWQVSNFKGGYPPLGLLVDTDPADASKLMLIAFQRLNDVLPYSYRWTLSGLDPHAFHDVVIRATLDDRDHAEGGVGKFQVWVNGQEMLRRDGRTLIKIDDVHRWAFGIYLTNESVPIAVPKVTQWRRARMLVE